MKMKTQQLIIHAISALIASSILMMLSYVQIGISEDSPPFRMGSNYVTMKKGDLNQQSSFDDIIDPANDMGVLIISRDEDSEIIGVYDPDMVMAFENTYGGIGTSRYFSYDDYVNNIKAGIVISDEFVHNVNAWYSLTSEEIDDVMYCTDTQSNFNEDGNIRKVVNMASLSTLGDYIYIDFGNRRAANNIIGSLKDSGYDRLSKDYVSLRETIFREHGSYDAIMIGGTLIYAFFCIAAFWRFYNSRKELTIHFLHGGTLRKVAISIAKQFVALSLISTSPVFVFGVFQRSSGFLMMSNLSLVSFIVIHILLTSLIYMVAFSLVFIMSSNRKRDEHYVR